MAQLGDEGAANRLEVFNRVAAHQTTADNPGLLPESIVVADRQLHRGRPPDRRRRSARTDLGTGSWSYARVTQHTQVGMQAGGEDRAGVSRKMLITKTPLARRHVRRLRQRVQAGHQPDRARRSSTWSSPISPSSTPSRPRRKPAPVLTAAATAGPVIPATPTGANVATAIWGAAGSVFTATQGPGPHRRRRVPRPARHHRPAVPHRQPAERLLDRVPGRPIGHGAVRVDLRAAR